jgi:hypothetical protein
MLTPKDLGIVIIKVTCIVSLKCKIIFSITSTYTTSIIYGNVGFLAGTITLEVAYSMTMVALNIGGAIGGCGWRRRRFCCCMRCCGVVSEAQSATGGVVDVEGAREVEGVIKKWAVVGAREVEGVIDVWQGVNELFTLVGCQPCNSFSANIASWNKWLTILYSL